MILFDVLEYGKDMIKQINKSDEQLYFEINIPYHLSRINIVQKDDKKDYVIFTYQHNDILKRLFHKKKFEMLLDDFIDINTHLKEKILKDYNNVVELLRLYYEAF